MNDPDDTEPTGRPDACTEGTDPGEGADDTFPDAPEEGDTDDFFRWLPTLWNGHRRRAELVERPSSEGADFASYACEGRPVAASARVRPEAKVQVWTDVSPRSRSRGRGESDDGLEASGRDAPTVVKRPRSFASGRALLGWATAGLLTVSASILWFTHSRHATEVPARTTAAVTLPVPTARTLAGRVEPPAPVPPSAGLPREAQKEKTLMAAAPQTASASAPLVKAVKAARGKGEPTLAPVDASPRATASVPTPAVPAKEQFFEDP